MVDATARILFQELGNRAGRSKRMQKFHFGVLLSEIHKNSVDTMFRLRLQQVRSFVTKISRRYHGLAHIGSEHISVHLRRGSQIGYSNSNMVDSTNLKVGHGRRAL